MLTYYPRPRSAGTRRDYDTAIRTVCQECPLHCGLWAYMKDGGLVDVQGVEDHPVSQGRLCARGLTFRETLRHPARLQVCRYRNTRDQAWQDLADPQPLFDLLAQRLQRLRDQQGPAALGILAGAAAGLDFYLGALVFASLWGTPKVYQERAPWLASALNRWVSPTAPCFDWPQTQTLILVEADPARSEPLLCRWLQEARRRGAKVLVADSRFTASAVQADDFLRLRPGTGNWLGLALLQHLHRRQLVKIDPELLPGEPLEPETLAAATGLADAETARLADWLASRASGVWLTGAALARRPGAAVWPVLAAALGWLEQPGSGWYPLAAGLPSFPQFGDPAPWPTASELQSLAVLISSGPALTSFLPELSGQELSPWLVHYGAFAGAAAASAQVLVPAALWPENEGLTCSNDRLWQWGARLAAPPPTCLSGLEFWRELAARFGWQDHFPAATDGESGRLEFYRRVLAANPFTAGLDLEAVRQGQPQSWPLGLQEGEPDTVLTAARLEPLKPPSGLSDQEAALFPLWWQSLAADAGPELVGLGRSRPAEEPETAWIQLHPDTAAALGLRHGDSLQLIWGTGECRGRAGLSRMVPVWLAAGPMALATRRILVVKEGHSPEAARQILQELLA